MSESRDVDPRLPLKVPVLPDFSVKLYALLFVVVDGCLQAEMREAPALEHGAR